MSVTLAIASRDFKGFFGTPLGWIAACILFLVSGVIFLIIIPLLIAQRQSMDPTGDIFGQILSFINYIYIFVIPAFTMRAMSEELSSGSYRILASSPISSWTIVLGKFLGIMFYFAVLGLLLLIYPLYGIIFTQIDLNILASGWFGLMLNTATIVSIGLFISSLTKNAVLSYLGSMFFTLLFIFSSFIQKMPEWYKNSANLINLTNEFTKGVVKTGSVSIFIAIILIFLFLSRFVLECRKWRV
jgi:ABC-2 type transport system permease protein